jgi:Mg2+ and Co2+ transporter CorA
MADETPFLDELMAANRVLVELDAIDECRSLSVTAIKTIAEAQRVLSGLQQQKTDELTPRQAQLVEDLTDRLRAKLKFFGRFV